MLAGVLFQASSPPCHWHHHHPPCLPPIPTAPNPTSGPVWRPTVCRHWAGRRRRRDEERAGPRLRSAETCVEDGERSPQ